MEDLRLRMSRHKYKQRSLELLARNFMPGASRKYCSSLAECPGHTTVNVVSHGHHSDSPGVHLLLVWLSDRSLEHLSYK
jgi:hypothetical protein